MRVIFLNCAILNGIFIVYRKNSQILKTCRSPVLENRLDSDLCQRQKVPVIRQSVIHYSLAFVWQIVEGKLPCHFEVVHKMEQPAISSCEYS